MAKTLYTNEEIAADFKLFREYVDIDGLVSEAQFDAADLATRCSWLDDCGWEDPVCCVNDSDHRISDEANAEAFGWRYQDGWRCPQCQ